MSLRAVDRVGLVQYYDTRMRRLRTLWVLIVIGFGLNGLSREYFNVKGHGEGGLRTRAAWPVNLAVEFNENRSLSVNESVVYDSGWHSLVLNPGFSDRVGSFYPQSSLGHHALSRSRAPPLI